MLSRYRDANIELPEQLHERFADEFALDSIDVPDGQPSELIVEQRERGLVTVLDHAGVVVDRSRDASEIEERVASLLRSLPARGDRSEGRRLDADGRTIVLLPSAAVSLPTIQRQLMERGVDVPAELGWHLDALGGATLIAGPMDPDGSLHALIAAVAQTCPITDEPHRALARVAERTAQVAQAYRVVGPPKELRDLILAR